MKKNFNHLVVLSSFILFSCHGGEQAGSNSTAAPPLHPGPAGVSTDTTKGNTQQNRVDSTQAYSPTDTTHQP